MLLAVRLKWRGSVVIGRFGSVSEVTSVTTTDNSPSQDYTHPDDQTTLLHVTPGFKPFTVRRKKFLIVKQILLVQDCNTHTDAAAQFFRNLHPFCNYTCQFNEINTYHDMDL